MRVRPQTYLETGRFEAIDRIGRRHLNPVHLTGAQRSYASAGLRHRHHDHAVELRDAVLVPVVRVACHLHADPRRHLVILKGPVPAGPFPNSVQLRPAFSHAVGLTIRMRATRYGKWLNGTVVLIAIV